MFKLSSWKFTLASVGVALLLGVLLAEQVETVGKQRAEINHLVEVVEIQSAQMDELVQEQQRANQLIVERDDALEQLRDRGEVVRTVVKEVWRDPVAKDWAEVRPPDLVLDAVNGGLERLRVQANYSDQDSSPIPSGAAASVDPGTGGGDPNQCRFGRGAVEVCGSSATGQSEHASGESVVKDGQGWRSGCALGSGTEVISVDVEFWGTLEADFRDTVGGGAAGARGGWREIAGCPAEAGQGARVLLADLERTGFRLADYFYRGAS